MKIQTKIALLFFAIGTLGIILVNASIFYFVSQFNFEDFFKRLEARVNLAAEINIHPDDKSYAYKEVRSRYLEKLVDEKDFIIKLSSRNNEFRKPLNLPDKFYDEILTKGKSRYNDDNRFYAGSVFNSPSGKYIVIVTASDPYGFKEIEVLRKVQVVVFLISVVLTYFVGRLFSYYTVRPLRLINRSVSDISATNLHLRLEEVKGKDEIAELTQNFNHMLTRLETAFETQNNFVSNASHELRTPLAIISGEAELLLNKPDLPGSIRDAVKTVGREAEKLEQILSSLIGLAQSGFNGGKQNWQKLRVDELVLQAVESVRKIEVEGTIEIDFNALPENELKLLVEGNFNLLHLAISNILLNACKYSNNQPVVVKVSAENERISVCVTDKGIGIPQEEQQHIFEPFFRASNTSDFEGYGIGLPLTLNIIRLHKGSIGIRSEENIGTEINVLLPPLF